MDKGRKKTPEKSLREKKLYKADASDAGKPTPSCQIAHVLLTTHVAHVAREVILGQLAPEQAQITPHYPEQKKKDIS